jgi:MFS family permease
MLTGGTLGDRFGRKRIMLAGVLVFSAASLMGALSKGTGLLIASRALMGAGAAASEPGTLSVIRHVFPESRSRARALGVWAGVSSLGLALGPVIGGVLVGVWDWRAVFYFNVAAGVALLLAAWRRVPESADPDVSRVDIPGQLLGIGTLGCAIVAVIQGENDGFASPGILTLFSIAAVCGVAFVLVEPRVRMPLLDLRYFRRPRFSAALAVAFTIYFGMFSIFFFTALYLQEVGTYSGYKTAALFAPMAVLMVGGAAIGGRVAAQPAGQWAMPLGGLFTAAGILLSEPLITPHPHFAVLATTLALTGLGLGIAIVPVTATVLDIVPAERSGMAASATNTARQLGVVFGVAVLGALVNAHLTTDLENRLKQLGVPSGFLSLVINAIKNGRVTAGAASNAKSTYGSIVDRVINAAYGAFHAGLSAALVTSAVLIAVASLFSVFVTLRTRRANGPSLPQ